MLASQFKEEILLASLELTPNLLALTRFFLAVLNSANGLHSQLVSVFLSGILGKVFPFHFCGYSFFANLFFLFFV